MDTVQELGGLYNAQRFYDVDECRLQKKKIACFGPHNELVMEYITKVSHVTSVVFHFVILILAGTEYVLRNYPYRGQKVRN